MTKMKIWNFWTKTELVSGSWRPTLWRIYPLTYTIIYLKCLIENIIQFCDMHPLYTYHHFKRKLSFQGENWSKENMIFYKLCVFSYNREDSKLTEFTWYQKGSGLYIEYTCETWIYVSTFWPENMSFYIYTYRCAF